MQDHRDRLIQQSRRQRLQKHLQNKRYEFNHSEQLFTQKQFAEIYPDITCQSYPTHKNFLSNIVTNSLYSYQIAALANIVYQHFVENNFDQDTIKILKYITQYEDVQLPQSLQFAKGLMNVLDITQQSWDSVWIVANLLGFEKYQSLFRNQLVSVGYIDRLRQMCKQLQQDSDNISLICDIFCSLLCSQPLLPLDKLSNLAYHLVNILKIYEQSKWQIFSIFPTLRQRMKPNKNYSALLLKQFEQLILKHKHGFERQVMDLLIYCSFSEVFSKNKNVLNIFMNVIMSSGGYSSSVIDKCLECFQVYFGEGVIDEMDIQVSQMFEKLWQFYLKSQGKASRQQLILKIMIKLAEQQLIQSFQNLNNNEDVLFQLIKSLEVYQLSYLSMQILKILVNQSNVIKIKFESFGGVKVLEEIYQQRPQSQDCQILDELLNIFYEKE